MEQLQGLPNPNQSKQPLWTITNITSDSELTPNGVVRGKVVHYNVLGTMDGTLFIADSQFNSEKVQSLVHKLAVEIVTTMSLEGPDVGQQQQPIYTFTPPET